MLHFHLNGSFKIYDNIEINEQHSYHFSTCCTSRQLLLSMAQVPSCPLPVADNTVISADRTVTSNFWGTRFTVNNQLAYTWFSMRSSFARYCCLMFNSWFIYCSNSDDTFNIFSIFLGRNRHLCFEFVIRQIMCYVNYPSHN